MQPYEVLVVEDQPEIIAYCSRFLADGFTYDMIAGGQSIEQHLRAKEYDLVLLDKNFSHLPPDQLIGPARQVAREGIEILKRIKSLDPHLPVIMITSYGDEESLSAAFRLGVFDYIEAEILTKDEMILRRKMENAVAGFSARTRELVDKFTRAGLVGQSPVMIELFKKLEEALKSESTVLLLGEPGVGKDVVARVLHQLSSRSDGPFVPCDMTQTSLIESSLFGVEPKSATQVEGRKGLFKQSDRGTLFLNEIGDLPLELQSKLLVSLENREFYPVGGNSRVTFDARIIAASNVDLADAVSKGKFRLDLFSRINQLRITVPSLGRRREDIRLLVRHFINSACADMNIPPLEITDIALKHLEKREWRGNVRELKHAVERMVYSCDQIVALKDVVALDQPSDTGPVNPPDAAFEALFEGKSVRDIEREMMIFNLKRFHGFVKPSHEAMKMSRATFYARVNEYDLAQLVHGYTPIE